MDKKYSIGVGKLASLHPDLERGLFECASEQGDSPSLYLFLSDVAAPFLDRMASRGEKVLGRSFFHALEEVLFQHGDTARSLIGSAESELRLWHHWDCVPKTLRQMFIDGLSWIPLHQGRRRINGHVDQGHYRKRWIEEIDKLGGAHRLSPEEEMRIRTRLGYEFKIEDLMVLAPDGSLVQARFEGK